MKGTWAARGGESPVQSRDSPKAGGFIRRKGDHRDRAGNRTWDLRTTADDRAATLALCAELEYDDEYDDSFDELAEVANVGSAAGEVSEGPPASLSGASRTTVGRRSDKGSNGDSGHREGQGGNDKSYWIADGRVYHSKKEGATRIRAGGVEEAAATGGARESAASRDEVHGLGAGGNRAAFDARAAPFTPGGGGGRGGGGWRGKSRGWGRRGKRHGGSAQPRRRRARTSAKETLSEGRRGEKDEQGRGAAAVASRLAPASNDRDGSDTPTATAAAERLKRLKSLWSRTKTREVSLTRPSRLLGEI